MGLPLSHLLLVHIKKCFQYKPSIFGSLISGGSLACTGGDKAAGSRSNSGRISQTSELPWIRVRWEQATQRHNGNGVKNRVDRQHMTKTYPGSQLLGRAYMDFRSIHRRKTVFPLSARSENHQPGPIQWKFQDQIPLCRPQVGLIYGIGTSNLHRFLSHGH